MGRAEEILEIADIIGDTAERLATVLERSGADKLHDPESLRAMARRELALAAVDIGCLAFGSPLNDSSQ